MTRGNSEGCASLEPDVDNLDFLSGHLVSVNLDEQGSKLGKKYLQRCFQAEINFLKQGSARIVTLSIDGSIMCTSIRLVNRHIYW